MTHKNFIYLAATVLMGAGLTACSSDLDSAWNPQSSNRPIRLTSSIDNGATRAASDLQSAQLKADNTVGLFAVGSSTDVYANVSLTVGSEGALSVTDSQTTLEWGENASLNFYAYTPYQSGVTSSSSSLSFSVKDDQSSEDNYIASDLLYGAPSSNPVTQTENAITLNFTHKLSKIIVTLQNDNGSLTLLNPEVSLLNVQKSVSLAISTGAVTTSASTDTKGTVKMGTDSTSSGIACVVPAQTIASGTDFIQIKNGDDTYICSLSAQQVLESGKVYSYTVKFAASTTAEVVKSVSLTSTTTNWDNNVTPAAISDAKKQVTYEVGDYLLADGSYIKKDNVSNATSDVIGVIFSTEVSETDANAGYVAYILGFSTFEKKAPSTNGHALSFGDGYTALKTLKGFAEDLDGLTHTKYVQETLDNTSYSTNYPVYDFSTLNNVITGNTTNFSQWFLPSSGQFIQILNNLGEANIPTDNTTYNYYVVVPSLAEQSYTTLYWSGKTYLLGTTPANIFSTLKTATNNTAVLTSGSRYVTSSLDNSKTSDSNNVILMDFDNNQINGTPKQTSSDTETITINDKTNGWLITAGNPTDSRNYIACIAAKSITQLQ